MSTSHHSSTQLSAGSAQSNTWRILGFVYFTGIVYLSTGLPIAILPPIVHMRMGFSAILAGFVISLQYLATLASRPWAGRISDHLGAKVSVQWGMTMCALNGAFLLAAALTYKWLWLSLSLILLSRLALGVGESLGSTGSTLWGIAAEGQGATAKVIGFNGVSTYGAMAVGAPLGVTLEARWGMASIGLLTIAVCLLSLLWASLKKPVAARPGERLGFREVAMRVAPHGLALGLGGVGYSVLATFITLFYLSRHWAGAALCLTVFGITFVFVRIFLLGLIHAYGGFLTAIGSMIVESIGLIMLWFSNGPWIALAGAAITGFGFSLVFPALGVEAVKRVAENNRGSALGVFTAFADVSFFLVGPIAGLVIGHFGYASVFGFALIAVLIALGITYVLRRLTLLAGYSF